MIYSNYKNENIYENICMRFGLVWFGFEKSIQNPIQSKRFSQNVIQTHPIIFGFVRFSVVLDRFAILIWRKQK